MTMAIKQMTRKEVIDELVQVEEHQRFFYECDPEGLMRFWFKCYNIYTNQELLEEYTETFEEDLKQENLQVKIVPVECEDNSVQKKG